MSGTKRGRLTGKVRNSDVEAKLPFALGTNFWGTGGGNRVNDFCAGMAVGDGAATGTGL